jgi:hypothetical protein
MDISSIISLITNKKTIFWIIIAIFFFILYWRSKKMGDGFKKVDQKIENSIRSLTIGGDIVFNHNTKEVLEDFAKIISDTSKISEFGFIISTITALISIFL